MRKYYIIHVFFEWSQEFEQIGTLNMRFLSKDQAELYIKTLDKKYFYVVGEVDYQGN